MIFIMGGIFILLIIYYFFFNTKKEGLESSSGFKPLINYDCLVEIDKKVFIPIRYLFYYEIQRG